jgi:3-oxoacyl-[acyl-carrier protein] reductase
MADRYQQFVDSAPGKLIAGQLGLPKPAHLRRWEAGQDLLVGPALVGGSGRLAGPAIHNLEAAGADVLDEPVGEDGRYGALVFDASGIENVADLHQLYAFFHAHISSLEGNGRLIVLGTPPEETDSIRERIAQRALEGFSRATAKEVRAGATANLIYVSAGAEDRLGATLRFFASSRSAFVDAQVVRVGTGASEDPTNWDTPQAGRVALVTGASRGIGEAIAETLARDGAEVVCLDVPGAGETLSAVANRIGGSALQLDITASDAPKRIAEYFKDRRGVDVVVHNAGVTRDKTLARMSEDRWDMLMAVNLLAPELITEALLEAEAIGAGGRIIGVSSISGIAGQRGQTNYSTSKAGVIGLVDAVAPLVLDQGITINAVAPGFIETQMTAAMPIATREAGRRLNTLSQGGLPLDVAETVAWFASPGSGGVTGNVVRVCGQMLMGA